MGWETPRHTGVCACISCGASCACCCCARQQEMAHSAGVACRTPALHPCPPEQTPIHTRTHQRSWRACQGL
jgi:hypothetical protein